MQSVASNSTTLTPDESRRVDQVVGLLHGARSILFITGAGLSADSGLPTYRGVGGLYEGRDPEEGTPIESILSRETVQARPDLTWKYLSQIELACRGSKPNRGHEVIAQFERHFETVWVLTQNVDGLHRRAGSSNVIAIHGDLHRIRCVHCPYVTMVADFAGFELPPVCPACKGLLRPDVVLFGERLPSQHLSTYQEVTRSGFDVVISVGTTSVFPYISAPVLDAYHLHKPSVEINPDITDVTEFVTIKLALGAAVALDAIWSRYQA